MTAQLLPNVYQQFFGITGSFSGLPLAGGKLFSYAAGTTTPLATYTDETAGTPNTNPIILNAQGAGNVWLGSLAYKFVLQDASSVVQWTVDNVSYINPGSIDLTKINSSIAGLALLQNGSGALDVQVDNTTIQITGNEIGLKSVPADLIPASSKMEVLMKYVRDYSCPGLVETIPQYEWTNPTLLSNPVVLPPGIASVVKWSHNGEFLAVGSSIGSPQLTIYQRGALGLVKITSDSPGAVFGLDWSPCGDFLAVVYTGTPCINIYQKFGNGFVTLPTPASVPTGIGKRGVWVSFSPNSDYLALGWVGTSGAIGTIMYERNSGVNTVVTGTASVTTNATTLTSGGGSIWTVFGTTSNTTVTGSGPISATATTILPGTVFSDITSAAGLSGISGPFSWSPDSHFFAALDTTSGLIDVFEINNSIFTGITGPAVSGFTPITGFSFSPDGNLFAVGSAVTPFVLLFGNPANVFFKWSNPATLPPGVASCATWSANSEYLLIGDDSGTSPYMTIYKVTNATGTPTFTAIAAPSSVPAGAVTNADWSQTKQFLAVATSTTPYLQVYETASVLPSNALLFTREAPNV